MERGQFQDAIDRFGPDLARWPVVDRCAAEALMAGDPEAIAMLAEACRLDALIRERPSVKAPHGLAARIVAAAVAKGLPEVSSPPTSTADPADMSLPRPAHRPLRN